MTSKTKCLLSLTGLALADIVIPVPVTALVLIYVVLEKPPWFSALVREIYGAG